MAQRSSRIGREVHDEPRIERSRITVRHVSERGHRRGLRPETVTERHNLDIVDVCRALAHYYDHPAEIRAVEAQRERAIESAREHTTICPPDR
jgi:uncharacterized protein (DUF433 family)